MEKSCTEEIIDTISTVLKIKLNKTEKEKITKTLERQKKWTYYPPTPNSLEIGKHSYYGRFFTCSENVSIGKYCSIADYVTIGLGKHPTNWLSTHPFTYTNAQCYTIGTKSAIEYNAHPKVIIGNDVWIGFGAKIMDGIKIGNGAIIGAGAVVTKDVPAYAIVGGVPAKIIKYRFTQKIINKLLELKWWNLPENIIEKLQWNDINICIEQIETYRNKKT